MDSEKREQAFDTIYMAILHGNVSAARRAFDLTLDRIVNEHLDEVIRLATRDSVSHLIDKINQLKKK